MHCLYIEVRSDFQRLETDTEKSESADRPKSTELKIDASDSKHGGPEHPPPYIPPRPVPSGPGKPSYFGRKSGTKTEPEVETE